MQIYKCILIQKITSGQFYIIIFIFIVFNNQLINVEFRTLEKLLLLSLHMTFKFKGENILKSTISQRFIQQ